MNWKEKLFGVPWENKNPQTREYAISHSTDPRLLTQLEAIAQADPADEVRQAACQRIDNLALLQQISLEDSAATVRAAALKHLQQIILAGKPPRPDLNAMLSVIDTLDERNLIEKIALQGPESELRIAALKRIQRQGFLGDRAIQDSDATVRAFAAQAISKTATLQRVINALRKKDKQLHHSLQQRLETMRLEQGDPDAIANRADSIYQALDELARNTQSADTKSRLDELQNAWNAIASNCTEAQHKRFQNSVKLVADIAHAPALDPAKEKAAQALRNLNRKLQALLNQRNGGEITEQTDGTIESADGLLLQLGKEEKYQALINQYQALQVELSQIAERPAQEPTIAVELNNIWQAVERYQQKPQPQRKTLNGLIRNWQDAWTQHTAANAAEKQLNQKISDVFDQLNQKLDRSEANQANLIERAEALLEKLGTEVEHGDLSLALKTRQQLFDLPKAIQKTSRWRELRSTIAPLQAQLREMRDWQHWANNKQRQGLIKRIEELANSPLHPDAVLAEIKDAQQTWRNLERSEQIPGDKHFAAAPWMWRKFSAACHAAFEHTKPFLQKRSEIRAQKQQQLEQLCGQIEAQCADEQTSVKQLKKLQTDARNAIRRLDDIPPKARKPMAEKLRGALDQIKQHLDQHYAEVEKTKRKLIRQAQQLSHESSLEDAIQQAKRLQYEWQKSGSLWRGREQSLWQEFRAPIDPLFEKITDQREQQQAELNAHLQEVEQLCLELEGAAKAPLEDIPSWQGKVAGLQQQFSELKRVPNKYQQRFEQAKTKFALRLDKLAQEQRQQTKQRWQVKLDLLQQLQTELVEPSNAEQFINQAQTQWPAEEAKDQVDQQLDERLQSLIAAWRTDAALPFSAQELEQNEARARALAIHLEFLAGLPSPKNERQERMNFQVNRLSETMGSGQARKALADEASELEQAWYALGALSQAAYTSIKSRIQASLAAIDKELP